MRKLLLLTGILAAFLSPPISANPWIGQIGVAPNLHDHAEPIDLHGARAAIRTLPAKFNLYDIQIFIEGSYAHYASNLAIRHESIDLLALSPVIRLSLMNRSRFHPYLEGGIGGAWLSKSMFADRQLGGHWQFQDMIGVGFQFGADRRFYAGMQTVHYSNAGLCDSNRGITVPLLLTFGMNAAG